MFAKNKVMKRAIILSVLAFASCQKEAKTIYQNKYIIDIRASFVNKQFAEGKEKIIVECIDTYEFETYSNPCLHQSFGFNATSTIQNQSIPYIIRTERDTLEMGLISGKIVKV